MANQSTNEPQFENFNDLNQAVEHIVAVFTRQVNSPLEETILALQYLVNFDDEDVVDVFDEYKEEIQICISEQNVTHSEAFGKFVRRFDSLKNKEGLRYITNQAIMCNTTAVFQNALFLLSNNDNDENSKKLKQLVGVKMLKILGVSERIAKFIPHQKPTGEEDLDFSMLFSSEILPRLDIERGFSLKKVNINNNRKFLSAVGLKLEEISSKYVYFAYSYSKEYELSSLLENLDNIPIEILIENQRKLIFFQKNVAEVDNFIARDKITQDMIDENPELEVFKLMPSESDLYLSNMITTRNVQVAVNVALAVKLVKASYYEGKPMGEIVEQLEANNIFIDFLALQKGVLEIIDEESILDNLNISKEALYRGCTDLLVVGAFSESLNHIVKMDEGSLTKSKKAKEGLPIFLPYPILRHIPGDIKAPQVNLEFLPFVVSSFKDLLRTYPSVLEIAEEIIKDKSQLYFHHGRLIENRESLIRHVLHSYIRSIHIHLLDLDIVRSGNIEGRELQEIESILNILQDVSPEFYEVAVNTIELIKQEAGKLVMITKAFFANPRQINRSVPSSAIDALDPLNITQKIREHGAKFNLKRRKKIRENIEDFGEES